MRTINILLCTAIALLSACNTPTETISQNEGIRPPAIPLITIDPYTSCWVFGDQLNNQTIYHWTGHVYPMNGYIKVDNETYRFMGGPEYDDYLPLSQEKAYTLQYTNTKPNDGWMLPDYTTTDWNEGKAIVGWDTTRAGINSHCTNGPLYVRRTFNWKESDSRDLAVLADHGGHTCQHMEFYINGVLAASIAQARKKRTYPLTSKAKKALVEGENVLAVVWKKRLKQKCYINYGLVKEKPSQIATQTGYKVTATQSEFNFTCGGVNLDVTFTAPMLMDNLDVMTRPANYITYQVKSTDGKKHDVAIYFDASSQMCVFKGEQEIEWESKDVDNLTLLKVGTTKQPILEKEGDDRLIDWGHLIFAAKKTPTTSFSIAPIATMQTSFKKDGKLPSMDTQMPRPSNVNRVGLAVVNNLGDINADAKNGYVILGYDDIFSIEYFGDHLPAWWKRNGMTTEEMILAADKEYGQLMNSCKIFDAQLYARAEHAGGKNYAELCILSYRQAISAHKLVADKNGTPLFFSKENYSNGSIGTVDVTYPSVPLFLLYNTTLVKGMLEPIFYYSESGKWTKNIAAHDVGKYPKANGQKYEEDMPVEECGNMLIMTNTICAMDNDYSYAKSHWETITIWANYLKEKGFDPDNQLCTDDFAGHLAHNSNLSIKAIVALGCYAQMAEKLNMPEESIQTFDMAKAMAVQWMEAAKDSGRYSLTFDKKGTWSQKYNLVWDKMLGLNLFPESVIRTELDWYKTVQNEFGLPLDSRADYTKSDWILWTAAMADNMEEFQFFMDPVYRFADETPDRLPLSDWHDTKNNQVYGFRARSVVGGYYMKILKDEMK